MQAQEQFFNSVLSEQGKPCLAWLVHSSDSNRTYFKHKVFPSVGEFTHALDSIDFTKRNYYFCISTLREDTVEIGGKERVRVQKNVEATRCFILDVDVRPDKDDHYHTIEEALQGVEEVRNAFNLPQPIIINSGFGLHVYWPMAGGIDPVEWTKYAGKFKRAIGMIAPRVVADGSRVADCAGVLRIPLSFNLKSNPPTPVEIVQWHDDFLDLSQFKLVMNRVVKDEDDTKTVDIGTVIYDSGPTELAPVAKKCAWVKDYLHNRQSATEPEWYAILGLAPFLVHTKQDGTQIAREKMAHLLSEGHPGYDPETTYRKYIQVTGSQNGPTLCARFSSIHSERCDGCPFRGSIKTPLQVAALDIPATNTEVKHAEVLDEQGNRSQEEVTIPLPPEPYFRGEDGGVYVRTKVKMEDGTWDSTIDRIYDYDFYPTKRLRTESTESESMECHLWLPHDGMKKFRVPSGLLAESKKLSTFLSDKGVITEYNKAPRVTKYLVDYIRHLQMTNAADIEFSRFGWRDALTAEPRFVVADGYYTKAGVLVPSGIAAQLRQAASAVTAKGDINAWKEAFNVYNYIPDSDPFILASLLGFAAPLMALTEYSGVLYNIVGDSAAGKSTALKLMTSVWGMPNPQQIVVKDTDNAVYNFIGYLSSVPVAFDEITMIDPVRLSDFLLSFTGGRGKMRADRNGQNRNNEVEWDTIVCSTSNSWLYTKLMEGRQGYNADQMRVFELEVGQSHERYQPMMDKAIRTLNENYGVAGRAYIEYLLPRLAQIKPLLNKAHDQIMSMGLKNHERFWGALLSCALVGAKIARDKLQLHSYDVEGLIKRLIGGVDQVRTNMQSSASDPASVLAEFMNTNLDATVRFKNDKLDVASFNGNLRAVKIRVESTGNEKETIPTTAYISAQAIKEYCTFRRIDFGWLRRELTEKNILKSAMIQKRLAGGSPLPSANARCWEIDLKHPALVGQLETPVE